ncbi:MAG TPA: hypothetical protein PKD68_00985 [Candidatus Saccharibacteria bacterium]|nr:hypothetical protein [Candidatus Saccharibacteria bacterium]
MTNGEHDGFTIIEVTLFLAISAMLLMIAFAFTNSTLRNMRFTDATKSLQSFFQQQYTRVQTNSIALNTPSGDAPRCAATGSIGTDPLAVNTAGASSTCILLGSVLDIHTNGRTITVSPVLGFAGDGTASLRASNPQIWTAAEETYQLQWQSSIQTSDQVGFGRAVAIGQAVNGQRYRNVNRLLFLKDTLSEKINFYAVNNEQSVTSWLQSTDAVDATNTIRNVPTLVCIRSDDGGSLRGAIQFGGTGRQQGIGIDAISSLVVSGSQQFFAGSVAGFAGLTCD